MYCFDDRDPQIQKPEAGDHPAHRSVHKKCGEPREVDQKLVVRPQWCVPGKHEHDDADVDADDDVEV